MNRLKCVLVGSPNSAKTFLIEKFMSGHLASCSRETVVTYDVDYIYKNQKTFQFRLYDFDLNKSNEEQCLHTNELDRIHMLILCYKSCDSSSKTFLIENYAAKIRAKWPQVPTTILACCAHDSELNESQIDQDLVDLIEPTRNFTFGSKFSDLIVDNFFMQSFRQVLMSEKLIEKEESRAEIKMLEEKPRMSESLTELKQRCCSPDKTRPESAAQMRNAQVDILTSETRFADNKKKLDFVYVNHRAESPHAQMPVKRTLSSSYIIVLVLFGLVCFIFYYSTRIYCSMNREKCAELYETSSSVLDESINMLNRYYFQFIQQLKH